MVRPRRVAVSGGPGHDAGTPYHGGRVMTDIPRAQDQLFDDRTSARAKYETLVVGRRGWRALLRHEIITLATQNVPGALGFALRKTLYPLLLGACGQGSLFGQDVVLRQPGKIRIGRNVVIDDHCLLDAKGSSNAGITIGDGVFIGRNTILSCKNGDITIEAGANIGFNCEIFSASQVRIGRDTLLAAYCYVVGGEHEFSDADAAVLSQGRRSQGVSIGDGAWLGAGVKVLDGVTIGDRAVIGAAALVRDAIPAGAVAVGIPARVVRQRDATERP